MTLMQADNNQPVIMDGKHQKGIGSPSNCHIGTKKAKKKKQENDMAEHMAKRFRVAPPTLRSSDCTTGGSMMPWLNSLMKV